MSHLYSTSLPTSLLPEQLRLQFRDLDHLLRKLIASAEFRVTLLSPFWSRHGITAMADSLSVAAERGALIRLIVDAGIETEALRDCLKVFTTYPNHPVVRRLRILRGTNLFTFIHAKVVLIDGKRGYLGSANFTAGGLERNFELGLDLGETQSTALEQLCGVFETKGLLKDCTQEVLR